METNENRNYVQIVAVPECSLLCERCRATVSIISCIWSLMTSSSEVLSIHIYAHLFLFSSIARSVWISLPASETDVA